MQQLSRMLRVALGLIMIALLIAGWDTLPVSQAAPQDTPTLKIGYLGPPGTDTANGAQLAIDQINTFGGITAPDGTVYRIELLTLDAMVSTGNMGQAVELLTAQNITVLLGPDDNSVVMPDTVPYLTNSGVPVLTSATSDTLTDSDATNVIFRLRAPERVYSLALATYLVEDLGMTSVAVVQTDVASTEAVLAFERALTAAGIPLADRIQSPGGTTIGEQVSRLLALNPGAVAMWGPVADAAELLRQLRDAGWTGRFVYRHAEEAARTDALSNSLGNGMIGATSWSYAFDGRATRIFLRDYVVAFGQVPGPLAAAAYDGMWMLRAAIIARGPAPAALKAALIGAAPLTLVQGTLHPIEYANGDLSRLVVVYELGLRGGSIVRARFDEANRIALDAGAPIAGDATAVPGGDTGDTGGTPANTPFPTATLQGTWIRVTVNVLNVRTGPSFEYDKIGEVELNDQLRILGAISDYSWLAIDFQGGVGWIKTEYAEVLGDLGAVSIIQAPPTPTQAATPTPTLNPNPDIVIDTVVLSPTNPVPGQPFTATVTVRNAGGGAAGRFAVAATWKPGDVYTSNFVEGLAGGQSTQVQLTATLPGTGTQQVGVVADLNKEVTELNEDNNVYNVTYRADYPLFTSQSGVQLNAFDEWDLYGGTPDILWDGYNIAMKNGSVIGIINGQTFETVDYDMLNAGVVNNTIGYGTDKVLSGMIYGLYTAEGQRAVLRVDNRQGETIWISYRVYNGTP